MFTHLGKGGFRMKKESEETKKTREALRLPWLFVFRLVLCKTIFLFAKYVTRWIYAT